MVGRFYSGAGSAAKMGIKLGAQVRAGEPLCVIEALKIPTLIEAARSGMIAEIFCQNGDAVEYGQPLLIIE
jgi:acetyl-CoA carboxylase biotin carboxyl carrier protein